MRISGVLKAVGLAAVLGAAADAASANTITVIHSTTPTYERGRELPPSHVLTLREGESVRLLMPNGDTPRLRGEKKQRLSDLRGGSASLRDIVAAIKDALIGDPDDTPPAGVRNAGVEIDGWSILGGSLQRPLTLCVATRRPKLGLAAFSDDARVEARIRRARGSGAVPVTLKRGETTDWPGAASFSERYQLRFDPGGVTFVLFKRVSPRVLRPGDGLIRRLVAEGCAHQARIAAERP